MSKLNIWNTISLAHTGKVKILDSGRQLFGTVVKHGVNDKTVTVNVSSRHYNHRYKIYLYDTKSKQVHDQHNYCVAGDKVIIANCQKLSATKAYYIKSIVKPFPRPMTSKTDNPTPTPQLQSTPIPQTPVQPAQQDNKSQQPPSKIQGAKDTRKDMKKIVKQFKQQNKPETSPQNKRTDRRANNNRTQDKSQKANKSRSKNKMFTKAKKSNNLV